MEIKNLIKRALRTLLKRSRHWIQLHTQFLLVERVVLDDELYCSSHDLSFLFFLKTKIQKFNLMPLRYIH